MIFKTIEDDATKSGEAITFLGKKISDIWDDLKNKKGIIDSIFKSENLGLSDDQVEILTNWNNKIKEIGITQDELNKIFANADEATQKYFKGLNGGEATLDGLAKATGKVSIGAKAAAAGMNLLKTALNSIAYMAIMQAIMALANVIITKIDEVVNAAEKCAERVDELMSSYESAISTANSNASRVETLAEKYKKLSAGVNELGQNVSLTTDEYEEYNEIVNEIADMFPTLVKGYTDEGNAILTLKEDVEGLRDAYKEAQKEAYNLLIVSGKDTDGNDIITNWNNTLHEDKGKGTNITKAIKELEAFITSDLNAETYTTLREKAQAGFYDGMTDAEKLIAGSEFLPYKIKFDLDEDGTLTDEELGKAKSYANALLKTYNAEIESNFKNIKTLANAYLMTNEDYAQLNEQSKTIASILVNNIPATSGTATVLMSQYSKEQIGEYVDYLVQALSADNPEVQKALISLFTIDFDTLSYSDAKTAIDKYVDVISQYLYEDPVEVKERLGFTEYDDSENLINNVKNKLQNEFDDKVGELSLPDLQIAAEIELDQTEIRKEKELEAKLKELEKDGSVNLLLRPQIDTSELNEKGWDAGEGIATVFSSTYSNEDGTVALNFTPIIADPKTGEYLGVLTPEELQRYAEDVIAGTRKDDLNLQIGGKFEGEDAINQAVDAAEKIHNLHERLYIDDDSLLSWDELKSKIEEAKITSDTAADSFDNISEKIAQIQENTSDTVANIKILNDAIDKVNNGENLSYDEVSELLKLDPSLASNFTKTVDGYSISIDELIAANDRIKGVSSSNIEQNIADTTQKIADSEAKIKKLNEERQKLYAEINANKNNEHYNGNETYERLLDIDEEIENLTNSIKNGQDLLSALQLIFGEISETASTIQQISLSDLSSSYDLLNSVTEEFNKNGNITVSTLESITNTYPRMKSVVDQYLQGLIDENELIEQLSNSYKTDEDNYYKHLLLKLGYEEDYINSSFEGNDSIVEYFAENYKIDLSNFKDYISRKQAIQEAFDKMVGGGISAYWSEEDGYTDLFIGLKDDAKVIIDDIIDEYKDAIADLDFQINKGEEFDKTLEGIKNRTSSALNAESDSKSSGPSSEFFKTFNWVEIAIEKVSKAASKLGNIVSNAFKSWTDRNSALKKQIKEVNKEIELQQNAYELYTQKANSVGLSDYWTNKIRNGSIDISVITDEDLADKIDEFKKWYDKTQDCKDAIDELKDSLSDLYMTSFDNVVSKYDDILSEIDFNKSMLDEKISQSSQSSYSSYSKNQTNLRKNIGYYEQLIAQEKKNIVQLEKEKAELIAILQLGIQNGTIVEGTEEWAKMRDQIDNITLAIAKANTSILDYGESINKVYEDLFNNISNKFEHQLNEIQHLSNSYDIGISSLEAKGYLGSVNFYTALQDSQRESISLLKQELASLEQAFAESGAEEYSDEWFEMREKILDVNKAIREGELSLLEYAKALREVEWEHFDYLQERISDITTEADFLIDLLDSSTLFDDKGNFTDKGLATLGLHAQNYNVYMAQADKYYQELLSIEKELSSDPYNTDLIKRREELLELQQKSILAAEDEKQAMIDLAKSGIEAELTALKELIQAYTDALDSAKSLHDYQRKIADQTSEIASLEKQLLAYENDNSEEARATKQKIKTNLEKAKDDLKETEYEKYISDQKELLDDLYAEYEEYMNKRLDNVDALLEDMIKTVNENAGEISDTLSSTAREVGYELSDSMQVIWSNAAGSITDVVSLYGSEFSHELTTVNQALGMIESNTAAFVQAANDFASQSINDIKSELSALSSAISGSQSGSGDNGSGSSNDSGTPSNPAPEPTPNPTTPTPTPSNPSPAPKTIEVGGKINAGNAPIYDYAGAPPSEGEKQVFANDPVYTVLSELDGFLKVRWHKLSSGVTGWFRKTDVKAYKTGGLVDFTGLAQLDGTPSKPEYVLSPEETKNFLALNETLKNVDVKKLLGINNTPNPDDYLNTRSMMSDIRAIQNSNHSTTMRDINITIPIDHVEDYNDFVKQVKNDLTNDKQFEKMIQSVTIDRAIGKSGLAKNKFRW